MNVRSTKFRQGVKGKVRTTAVPESLRLFHVVVLLLLLT